MVCRIAAFLAVAVAFGASPSAAFQMGDATQTICADGTGSLCSTLPTDMNAHPPSIGYIPATGAGGAISGFNQTFVDYFGWQAFVALNWPVGTDGKPSTTRTITTDTSSPRVWSTYKTKEDVFGTQIAGIPGSTCAVKKGNLKLFRTSKFELSNFTEAFTPYPLIDRYGNFVVYDVRLNDTEVQYLTANNLTTKAGQAQFGKPYDFPEGSGANVGAIEIKTSWRIMTDKDDKQKFYTTGATIIVPPQYSETNRELCLDVTVGLVGMHIMQKFTNPADFSNFWMWATFEHAQNAPLADNAPVSQINAKSPLKTLDPPSCNRYPNPNDTKAYSFYNNACNNFFSTCPINTPPAALKNVFKWSATQPYAGSYMVYGLGGRYGTQVARCFDIYPSAQAVTDVYQTQFGSSPWSNYMLVGAQWASAGSTGSAPFNKLRPFPAPIYLANTTSETYLQLGPVMNPDNGAGSCVTCHNLATDTANNNANFSFLPGDAQ